jgi:hypothetical protein
METPARHPRGGDCIIREVVPSVLRVKVLVDYPQLGLNRQAEFPSDPAGRYAAPAGNQPDMAVGPADVAGPAAGTIHR